MACIIVLGGFRSGTSAVAGAIHHLGVFMGSEFDPPGASNPKGFFEDLEFKDLHKLLSKGENVEDEYKALVESRQKTHPLWGLKDPLLCLVLHRVRNWLPTESKLVVVRRPNEAVAASMARATGEDPGRYLQVAEYYEARREAEVSNWEKQKLVVEYDLLVRERESQVGRLAEFIGLAYQEKASNWLEPRGQ